MSAPTPPSGTGPALPFRDPGLSDETRLADLMSRLTLAEKVGQVNQHLLGWTAVRRDGDGYELTDALAEEIERFGGIGAVYGLHRADAWSGVSWESGVRPEAAAEVSRRVKDAVVAGSRLGIPPLLVEEAPHGHQGLGGTVFPTNIGLAASWDPGRVERIGAAVAAELASAGADIALVSGLDMLVDPRWGRSEESFGEDPYLASALVQATVRGMQGEAGARIGADRVGVVVKHLAAQGAGAGGRNAAGAQVGPRELREVHLPAAHAAALAGVVGFMSAYNDVDGIPCSANRALLTGTLREGWGWRGLVMADMGALDRLAAPAGGLAGAAGLALRAGVDLSLIDDCYRVIEQAIDAGLAREDDLDRACENVLAVKLRLGLLDDAPREPVHRDRVSLVRRSIEADHPASGMVLLRNHRAALPMSPQTRRVAVIGPNATEADALLGDYVAPHEGDGARSIAQALSAEADLEVRAHRGSRLRGPLEGGIDAARELAGWADTVVLVLGGSSRRSYHGDFDDNGAAGDLRLDLDVTGGEGVDLAEVDLPRAQRELWCAVRPLARRVVAVVVSGRPHGVADLLASADALLWAWYPGPRGGAAIVDILRGRLEPGGRMPASLPLCSAVLPTGSGRRLEHSRGYVDAPDPQLVPLGAGTGYTGWACGATVLVSPGGPVDLAAGCEVEVEVRNTGPREGEQVVQLYGRHLVPGVTPRSHALLGFARIRLAAGRATTIRFRIDDTPPLFASGDRGGRLLVRAGFDAGVDLDDGLLLEVSE